MVSRKIKSVILNALGITLGLGIQDLVQDLITTVYGPKNDLHAKAIYVLITLLVLIAWAAWMVNSEQVDKMED